jgi:hypothetical protein
VRFQPSAKEAWIQQERCTSGAKAPRISIIYGPTKSRALIQSQAFQEGLKPCLSVREFFDGYGLSPGINNRRITAALEVAEYGFSRSLFSGAGQRGLFLWKRAAWLS